MCAKKSKQIAKVIGTEEKKLFITGITEPEDKTKKNQFIVNDFKGKKYYFNNNLLIVKIVNSKVYLDKKYWEKDGTTKKYRNKFLNETTKIIKDKVNSGEYTLVDLNK